MHAKQPSAFNVTDEIARLVSERAFNQVWWEIYDPDIVYRGWETHYEGADFRTVGEENLKPIRAQMIQTQPPLLEKIRSKFHLSNTAGLSILHL